jgi:antitoxin ParD1/3/4
MNVPLTPDMEKLVSEKVKSGEYPDATAVLEDALRLLKERDQAEARLEALLREGIESGDSADMTEADWQDIRREVRQRHAQLKTK